MSEQKFNRQELIEYLLGSLPEAGAERFDELSFINEEFADELAAAEKDLIDAFVHRELSGATLAKFESYYLSSPLRREKVEFAKIFQAHARKNLLTAKENAVSEEGEVNENPAGIFSFLNIFKNRNLLATGFAVIAIVLLAASIFRLAGNFSNRQNNETATQNTSVNRERNLPAALGNEQSPNPKNEKETATAIPQDKTIANSEQVPPQNTATIQPAKTPAAKQTPAPPKITIASFVLAPPLRGSGQIKTLSIPEEAAEISINLELEPNDYTAYRVALTDESGSATLWQSGRLKAAGNHKNRQITIRLFSKLLKSRIYNLVVSGINPAGEAEIIGNYSFRSVLK